MRRGHYKEAQKEFDRVIAGTPSSSPLRQWAEVTKIAAFVQDSLLESAERASLDLRPRLDSTRHPALAARASWVFGSARIRRGYAEDALVLFERAGRLYTRAGETENAGNANVLSGDARYSIGDVASMHASMYQGLRVLHAYRGSIWLHNLLKIWAEAVAGEFPRAAALLQEEGIGAARATRSNAPIAEARLARALLATAAGDTTRARAELAASRTLLDSVPASRRRDWLRADQSIAEAALLIGHDALAATAKLDSVIVFFDAVNEVRFLTALVARSEAHLAAGKAELADADMERAVDLIETQHSEVENVRLRTSLLDAARRTIDRLVMRRVNARRDIEALRYMDHARASFAPVPRSPRRASRSISAPPGTVAIQLSLIGDTLLAWTVSDTVHLTRSTIDQQLFRGSLDRLHANLELRSSEAELQRDLTTFYDWLLRPIEHLLPRDERPIVIAADGEIASVPFAALYDTTRKQYFVEQHPIRFVSRLSDAVTRRPTAQRRQSVLFVADPAFDGAAFPALGRLHGATQEVDSIAGAYRNRQVLADTSADPPSVLAALPKADVVHFAGHAVFDDDRPERSYLVLASSAHGVSARLTATEVADLHLDRVRLLILSACQTSRTQPGRSGGFAGLTGAFLAAGVGGVIGSLWRVDDDLTRSLMVDFHKSYRAGVDPIVALRTAQLNALRSSDPARRSPAGWAGFRYTGE
jgi:CHAT domain-containing protein